MNSNFRRKSNSGQKSKFWSKIKMLVKNQNIDHRFLGIKIFVVNQKQTY